MAMRDINDLEKWNTFCARLVEKTIAGEVEWTDWSHLIGRPDSRSLLFVTTYREWNILVYKYAYQHFQDEDSYEWNEEVAIELIDKDGKVEWTIPKVPTRHKLLDHIQYIGAEVDSLLDAIIDGEEG